MVDYEDYEGIEMILVTIIVTVLITNITLCSMVIHRKKPQNKAYYHHIIILYCEPKELSYPNAQLFYQRT